MIIHTLDQLPDLSNEPYICVDVETNDPDLITHGCGAQRNGQLKGISVGLKDGRAFYVPEKLIHYRKELCTWLDHSYKYVIGAYILYDLEYLAVMGLRFRTKMYIDVAYAEAVLHPTARSYSLAAIAHRHLGKGKEDSEIYGVLAAMYGGNPTRRAQAGNLWRAPLDMLAKYAESDVHLPIEIFRKQRSALDHLRLMDVFEMECQLIPVLLGMRLRGVPVDEKSIQQYEYQLQEEKERITKELGDVNVNSSKELALLFKAYDVEEFDLTEKGNISITDDWLKKNSDDIPVCKLVRRKREIIKLSSTFVGKLLPTNNGRVYTAFHPLRNNDYGTVTGRFSSSNPNLQNIPARDEAIKKAVRGFFIPEEEHDWWSFDYKQIEYLLLVNFGVGANAHKLRELYKEHPETDFHQVVIDWTGLPRKAAKTCNFLLVYGGGLKGLSKLVSGNASQLMETYHAKFPMVRETFNYYKRKAAINNMIRTISGRYRPLSSKTYRLGLNSFLQGSAADIIKKAMVEMEARGIYSEIGYPLLIVHDEIDFSMPKDISQDIVKEIEHCMTDSYTEQMDLKLQVSIEKGANWGDLHDVTR